MSFKRHALLCGALLALWAFSGCERANKPPEVPVSDDKGAPAGKSADPKTPPADNKAADNKKVDPKAKPVPKHLEADAKDLGKLSDKEYLMRKATLGTRSERFEALDVIDRTLGREEKVPFLVERLQKEDDGFLQVRIMQALNQAQDVRAIDPMRKLARQKDRVGVEAVRNLYDLGDDSQIPVLIAALRNSEDYPELSKIALRGLKEIYQVEIPPSVRLWNTYYRSHRLTPYMKNSWYSAYRPAPPPTVEGTTQIAPHPKGAPQLPQEDVRVRQNVVSFYEFWRPDEP